VASSGASIPTRWQKTSIHSGAVMPLLPLEFV
jgi:hypothetical protein